MHKLFSCNFGTLLRTTVCCASVAFSLTACGMSNWQPKFTEGQTALTSNDAGHLAKAESCFRAAIADAKKNRVPESQYSDAITALGRVLCTEGKYTEAQQYLERSVALSVATNMSTDENCDLLSLLATAYEKNNNIDQAVQTQSALVNLLEAEKSPLSSQYARALAEKQRLAQLAKGAPKEKEDDCCHVSEAGSMD